VARISGRRPNRSARRATITDSTTPTRTAASVLPWAVRPASNWAAAKVMVWLMTVPR
jgi:hypothetical protein